MGISLIIDTETLAKRSFSICIRRFQMLAEKDLTERENLTELQEQIQYFMCFPGLHAIRNVYTIFIQAYAANLVLLLDRQLERKDLQHKFSYTNWPEIKKTFYLEDDRYKQDFEEEYERAWSYIQEHSKQENEKLFLYDSFVVCQIKYFKSCVKQIVAILFQVFPTTVIEHIKENKELSAIMAQQCEPYQILVKNLRKNNTFQAVNDILKLLKEQVRGTKTQRGDERAINCHNTSLEMFEEIWPEKENMHLRMMPKDDFLPSIMDDYIQRRHILKLTKEKWNEIRNPKGDIDEILINGRKCLIKNVSWHLIAFSGTFNAESNWDSLGNTRSEDSLPGEDFTNENNIREPTSGVSDMGTAGKNQEYNRDGDSDVQEFHNKSDILEVEALERAIAKNEECLQVLKRKLQDLKRQPGNTSTSNQKDSCADPLALCKTKVLLRCESASVTGSIEKEFVSRPEINIECSSVTGSIEEEVVSRPIVNNENSSAMETIEKEDVLRPEMNNKSSSVTGSIEKVVLRPEMNNESSSVTGSIEEKVESSPGNKYDILSGTPDYIESYTYRNFTNMHPIEAQRRKPSGLAVHEQVFRANENQNKVLCSDDSHLSGATQGYMKTKEMTTEKEKPLIVELEELPILTCSNEHVDVDSCMDIREPESFETDVSFRTAFESQ
ncbi:hypothetical protein SK128_024073 [Halocaridina rubra]|uniref:Uncharacterized protein n=1 Tax=Halocaridina rubra TaxID=373956 RepID=A0AAN8X327_HALRR